MNLKSKSFFAHKTINWCSVGAQHATMPEAILPEATMPEGAFYGQDGVSLDQEAILPEGAFYGQEAAPLHGITPFNLETV